MEREAPGGEKGRLESDIFARGTEISNPFAPAESPCNPLRRVFRILWNASAAILVLLGRLRRPEAMTRAAGGNLLALSLATAVSVAAQAADEIKSGK